jgi:hypothetical protein
VKGREAKRAQRRSDIEARLSASLKAGLLEAAYRHSELKTSNAFYKFGICTLTNWGPITGGSLDGMADT